MQTTSILSGVIQHNRALLLRARELNRRAGAQIFSVPDRESLTTWLTNRLQGTRRGVEVTDLESLKLPELNQAEVSRVLSECPDTLVVLGIELPVEYREGYAPRITLNSEQVTAYAWRELNDAGVTLPNDRLIEVVVPFSSWDTLSGTDIPDLKSRCVSRVNRSLWDSWNDRPEISLPDPTEATSEVLEIIEAVYGASVIDDTPLVAYGAVGARSYRYYPSDPWFEGKWFQSRDEAEVARNFSIAKLVEIREEIRQKALVEAAKADAEAARGELRSLQSREGWRDLDTNLQQRAQDRQYTYLPSGMEELTIWTSETRSLVAQVEAELAAIAERKAEEERQRLEAEKDERSELAVIFEATRPQTEGFVCAGQSHGIELAEARQIRAFAETCVRCVSNNREAAIRKLRREFYADYGRARRQSAMERGFPGLNCSEAGETFLRYYRAEDVDRWLEGAIAWLDSLDENPKSPAPAPTPKVEPRRSRSSEGLDLSGLADQFTIRKKK